MCVCVYVCVCVCVCMCEGIDKSKAIIFGLVLDGRKTILAFCIRRDRSVFPDQSPQNAHGISKQAFIKVKGC